MSKKKLDALFFGSHPDDVELICSGTLAKLTLDGWKTGIVDLTRGELSSRGDLKTREMETEKASKILGVSYRKNLGLKDGNIINSEINRKKIISVIRETQSDIVFAPYPLDRHPDHINASNLIRESVFYSGLLKLKTGSQKPFRPGRVFYYKHAYDIPVSFVFDISETFDIKMKAIEAFATQFFTGTKLDKKYPETFVSTENFRTWIIANARYFGSKIGVKYGEPFFSYEPVKVESNYLKRI